MGWEEILLRLGAAAVIGSVIGINREIHHKSAGFRTIAIVCVGTALAVLMGTLGTDPAASSRVMQGVITGIGFLGGGVIVHRAQSETVEGLTTAASVWTTAMLGAACGLGYWLPAAIGAGLVVILLVVGGRVETAVRQRFG